MNRTTVRIVRGSVFVGALAIVAYFVYFSGVFKPTILTVLGREYSFEQLTTVVIAVLGKPTVVAIATGYVALAAFFTSLQSSGGFASLHPRVAGIFLVNQILSWFIAGLVIVGLRVFPYSLYAILVLYLPLAIAALYSFPTFATDLTFAELEQSKGNSLSGQVDTFFLKRLRWPHILLMLTAGEILYFFNNNPIFPLLGWLMLGWALLGAVLSVASAEGYAFQLINWKYVSVQQTIGEPFEGYLISKGPDHYIFVTKDKGTFLLPSNSVREIRITNRPARNAIESAEK